MVSELKKSAWKRWRAGHRETFNAYQRKWKKANPEKVKLIRHQNKMRLRHEVLGHYAKPIRCARCGIEDLRVLTIDHLNGGGSTHRKEIGNRGGIQFYRWLKKEGFPQGYRVLCFNCQFITFYERMDYFREDKPKV